MFRVEKEGRWKTADLANMEGVHKAMRKIKIKKYIKNIILEP